MLDASTFLTVWYWAVAVAIWSEIGASAHGVPVAVLRDANRGDPQAMAIADALARRSAARVAALHERWAWAAVAGAAAAISCLAVLAFAGGSEIALGLLLIVAPTVTMAGFGLREALLIHRHAPDTALLLEVVTARRRANLTAGVFSVSGSILVFAILYRDRIAGLG